MSYGFTKQLHRLGVGSNGAHAMSVKRTSLLFWFAGIFLLLLCFALLCYSKSGETLMQVRGEVKKCETLGAGQQTALTHATIEDENGNFIIATLDACVTDTPVVITIQRGALYFNTVYAAQPVNSGEPPGG